MQIAGRRTAFSATVNTRARRNYTPTNLIGGLAAASRALKVDKQVTADLNRKPDSAFPSVMSIADLGTDRQLSESLGSQLNTRH
jgi:hypothetical protein